MERMCCGKIILFKNPQRRRESTAREGVLTSTPRAARHDPLGIPSGESWLLWRFGGGERQAGVPALQAGCRSGFDAGRRLGTTIPGVRAQCNCFHRGFHHLFSHDPRTVNRSAEIVRGNDGSVAQCHAASFHHFSNSGHGQLSIQVWRPFGLCFGRIARVSRTVSAVKRVHDSYSASAVPSNHFYGNHPFETAAA